MRKITLFILLTFCIHFLFAQAPAYLNYQAVVSSSAGDLITNQNVGFRFSILQGSSTGIPVYVETQSGLSNAYGMCNQKIGEGTQVSGQINDIDWSSGTYFLKVEIDQNGGSDYTQIGSSKLLSVPYSLFANKAEQAKSIESDVLYFTDSDTLFAVKDHDGNIVFAVFPDGAKVYVNEQVKGSVGGFAVSGRSPTKSTEYNVFNVTPDSARFYINENIVKGRVGGFAVSGRSPTKGDVNSFLDLTPENYFIGYQSGVNILTGTFNSVLGYESGANLNTGSSNAFLGYQSGYSTSSGFGNLFLGYQSGYNNIIGNYNTFMGYQAGFANIDGTNNSFLGSFTGINNIGGSYNTFVGDSTGFNNISGNSNSFIGTKVGFNNTIGWANLFMGNYAGFSNMGGFENVFIGDHTGYSNIDAGMNVFIGVRSGYYGEEGWNNVYLGTETGYNNIDGEGNVFIGFQTGMNNTNGKRNIYIGNRAGMNEQGSGKLIIDNQDLDSTSTFLWGDLNARFLRFNSWIGMGTNPSYAYNLSVYNESAPAIINLLGVGNTYDYAQLRLEADIGTDTLGYQIIHDIGHRLRILYDDGINYFPRFSIDTTGKVMIGGSWVDATEMLDVDGNARFRTVGSATQVNDLGITVDGVLTTSTSDKRLKEDITPINNSLAKVLKLNGYTFNWKGKENIKKDAGLIAQEVEMIFPEAVYINPNDGYYGINYSRFPALFVEAIKEQQKEIYELKEQVKQIEDLKSENQLLKEKLSRIEEMLKK